MDSKILKHQLTELEQLLVQPATRLSAELLLPEDAEAFSESDLPWKVDLVDWATISERFQQVIAAQKLLFKWYRDKWHTLHLLLAQAF